MGMQITADHTGDGPPWPVSIAVSCDRSHGLFDRPSARFDCTDDHPRTPPMRAGWKFLPDGDVLCPSCAGR